MAKRYGIGHYPVAPLAGARIETEAQLSTVKAVSVAPLAGARIETGYLQTVIRYMLVAPLAGARIETVGAGLGQRMDACRSPRGSAN